MVQMKVATKCFAVVAAETRIETTSEIVKTLTNHINQHPKFVLVFGDMKETGDASSLIGINTVLILSSLNTQIFSFYCTASNRSMKMTWRRRNRKEDPQLCVNEKREIDIAYNFYQPYFYVENQQPYTDTLEAIIITTFLETNNLKATYNWAEQKWGRKDVDGRFNGAVGMVRYINLSFFLFKIN